MLYCVLRGEIMRLHAKNLHFLGKTEEEKLSDCCVHGNVIFEIDGKNLSDDGEWCISASVYRFLHTLSENHFSGAEEFLIPCCGHTLIPSDDQKTVTITGCNVGLDFDILHENGNVIIDGKYTVPFDDYKSAVLSFAKEIGDFYRANPPRKLEDNFEKDGLEAFFNEFSFLYNNAAGSPDTHLSFDDYDCYSEDFISGIIENGISLSPYGFINFRECAYNFGKLAGRDGKCVGTKESDNFTFNFYTSKKPTVITFVNKFAKLRSDKFYRQILKYGYRMEEAE